MEREIDGQISAASAVIQKLYLSVVVNKELSRMAKLDSLLVQLCSSLHLWSRDFGHG